MASKCCDVEFKNPNSVIRLADGNMEFALNLYQSYVQRLDGGNAISSPFSILVALSMTSVGARNKTAEELRKALKLDIFKEDIQAHEAISDVLMSLGLDGSSGQLPFLLSTANRMYLEKSYAILEDFQKTLKENYKTDAIPVDFVANAEAARLDINKWVEDVTRQKIKDLMPAGILDDLTRLVLVNAIYFKGFWEKRFKPKDTLPRPFYKTEKDKLLVPMMVLTEKFLYAENKACQMLWLPYTGNRLGMLVVLPSKYHTLYYLEKQLNPEFLKSMMKSMSSKEVRVMLPKFRLEVGMGLNGVLNDIGIKDLFSQWRADLTGISPSNDLFVSAVLHKAFIDVNEEGTEAAAATVVGHLLYKGGRVDLPRQIYFIADHPFLFFIYDRASKMILFIGRLTDPPTEFNKDGKTEL